jgi:hypothetical protein
MSKARLHTFNGCIFNVNHPQSQFFPCGKKERLIKKKQLSTRYHCDSFSLSVILIHGINGKNTK